MAADPYTLFGLLGPGGLAAIAFVIWVWDQTTNDDDDGWGF